MAPRPKKHRHCCGLAKQFQCFKPAHVPLRDCTQIHLAADEYTALQLCDGQGLTQQQAGEQMGVSRGTVQRLVTQGRATLIKALQDGAALIIGNSDTNHKPTEPSVDRENGDIGNRTSR